MAATHSWPVRIARVVRATVRDAVDDDLAGEAAKVAYYFFLSLFPFVLNVFALTGLVGGDAAFSRITLVLESAMPRASGQFIRELLDEVSGQPQAGVLSLGIVLTLWAASKGVAAITKGLNTVYEVEEHRSWWKRRLLALAVLVGVVLLIVLGASAFAPGIELLRRAGLSDAWRVAMWPFAIALLTAAVWLAYYYLPARNQQHARGHALAGALVAMALWLLATGLFHVYVTNFGRYGRVYGAVGAVIVLLIWFYISAFAVLVGGELGAQLERERLGKDSPAAH